MTDTVCPADSNAVIPVVAVGLVSLVVLATIAGILRCCCCKRKRRLPDLRSAESDTDLEMVCIAQINDGFTLAAVE